jgi:predicted nucleic acid-binding protein
VKLVLDASVAVAAVRPLEPDHLAARARVSAILMGQDQLVVPSIFPIEVTSALARRAAWPKSQIEDYVARLLAPPSRLVTIGPRRASGAARVAAVTRIRAADALYVWLASREGVALVTSDAEITERAAAVCTVHSP